MSTPDAADPDIDGDADADAAGDPELEPDPDLLGMAVPDGFVPVDEPAVAGAPAPAESRSFPPPKSDEEPASELAPSAAELLPELPLPRA